MEGEENFFCKHCNADFSLRDYAVHQMTNTHLRKLKRELLDKEFAAVCRACNRSLQNLKMVETHVQEGSHLEKVNSFSSGSFLSSSKFTCKVCAVAFYNEIAMEVHQLMHSNGLVLDLTYFTSLSELVKQLDGLPEESTLSFISPVCVVCNMVFDNLDELTLHLLSVEHFFRLRTSSCILCKKEFNHVSDRETHLTGSKHKAMVEKCENFLEHGRIQLVEHKGGYLCMYCMLWCHSWYSLKLHILDSSHHKTAVRVRKALIPANWKLKYYLSTDAQCQGDSHCDALAVLNWKKWRDEPGGSVWCHQCGMILPGPDAANAHLKEHGMLTNTFVSKSHNLKCPDTINFPGLFECSYCMLSFKSAFLLSIHEVYYEHHQSISMVDNANLLNCCAKCGLLVAMDKQNLSASAHKHINALSSGAHPSKNCMEVLSHQVPPLKYMNRGRSCPENNLVLNNTGQLADGKVLHATCEEINQTDLQVHEHGLEFMTNMDDVMKVINQQMPDGGLVFGNNSSKAQKGLTGPCDPTVASIKTVEGMNIKQDATKRLHGQGPPCSMCDTENCRVGSSQGFELHGLGAQSVFDKGHLTPKDNCTGESLNVVNLSQVHTAPLSHCPLIGKDDNCFQEGSRQGLPPNGAAGQSIPCPFIKDLSDASAKVVEDTCQPLDVACTDELPAFSLMSAQVPITSVSVVDREVQQDNGTPVSQACDASGSSHAQGSVLDAKCPDLRVPVFAAAAMAPPKALQESLHSVMSIVTEALSAAMSMSLQQHASCTGSSKQKRGGEGQTDGSDVKRLRSEEILSAALQKGLKSACVISAVTKNTDAGGSQQQDNLTLIGGKGAMEGASPTDCENVEQKAVLAVAATILTSSRSDVRCQVMNAGLAEQSGGGSVSKDCNCSKPNNSYASPVSHGETEYSIPTNPSGNTMQFLAPVLDLPLNLQESSTQTNTGRDKEELPSHTSTLLDNAEEKPSAEAKNVGKLETYTSSVSEDNESSDDCEKFLGELKNQEGWWMLSDSDDSGAL